MIKLIIVYYDYKDHKDKSIIVETKAKKSKGLLMEAKKLAEKYSVYDKWKNTKMKADVFIFDPKKSREDVPPCLSFVKVEYLHKIGGYAEIARVVKEAQGVELTI